MTCKVVGGHYLENSTHFGLGQLVPGLVGSIWNDKAKVWVQMTCKAVGEQYLEEPAKLGSGQVVPGLVGSIQIGQANVVLQ